MPSAMNLMPILGLQVGVGVFVLGLVLVRERGSLLGMDWAT